MLGDSIKRRPLLSVTHYCFIATAIVLTAGLYSSIQSINLLEMYIDCVLMHEPHPDGPKLPQSAYDGVAVSLGGFLRDYHFPFSEYYSSNQAPHQIANQIPNQATPLTAEITRLYDVRAGLIYIRLLTFLFLLFCMIWVTSNIRGPVNAISRAVDSLAKKQFDKPIKINGPLDVLEISSKLERLRRLLHENDRQQMLFLRHVSHEIKTPLASIKEGATLLDDDSLGSINKEQREVTDIILRASRELQDAVEDLLVYNSAVSSDNHQHWEQVELVDLLEQTIAKHRLSLHRNKITIRKILNPISAKVDLQQVQTVFDNLLSNAIKYAPPESEIRVWLRKARNGSIEFTIRDQGPGVAKKHRHAIFDAFYMGDKSTNAVVKGTGLGLSIAKQYVEAHHGSIKLLETRNGATFKVTLNPPMTRATK